MNDEFEFSLDDILNEARSLDDEPASVSRNIERESIRVREPEQKSEKTPREPKENRRDADSRPPQRKKDEASAKQSPKSGRMPRSFKDDEEDEEYRETVKPSRKPQKLSKKELKAIEREAKEREKERKRRIRLQRRRRRLRKLKIVLIVILACLAVLAAAATFLGIKVTKSETNLPGTYVGEIPVEKLTREQTAQTLKNYGWDTKVSTPVKVNLFNVAEFEVEPLKTGTVRTAEETADEAHAYGHGKNIFENLFLYAGGLLKKTDVNSAELIPDREYIRACISSGAVALNEYLSGDQYTIDAQAGEMKMKKGWPGITLDEEKLASEILSAVAEGRSELPVDTYSGELTALDFNAIHAELEREPADAYYSDDGRFEVTDEVVGCRFDVAQAQQIWQNAAPGEEVTIPLDVTFPEITGEILRSRLFGNMLGAMTTRYTNSGDNRCSNVRLGTSKINGTVLYPGDEFSYNDVVGARTEEAGFLPAPAYVGVGADGVKDEIGGGACQISSTLYAATVFSFLETLERHNHVYPVNYIQLGTDATVTIPSDGGNVMDFKFRNNKNYPIKIVGYTNETEEEKTLTFEIWGTLEENDFMPVEFDNSWYWDYDYDRFIDPQIAGRPGYKIKLTHETYSFADDLGPGARTLTHRQVIAPDGSMVVDEIINPTISTGYAMDTYYNHSH